jgi:hypothetical protein
MNRRLRDIVPYALFAIQARRRCKEYGVSAEYMEVVLRIEWHRKVDHWSEGRYKQELAALYLRFPEDATRHVELKGNNDT